MLISPGRVRRSWEPRWREPSSRADSSRGGAECLEKALTRGLDGPGNERDVPIGEQLSFEHLVALLRTGGPMPDAPVLIAVARRDLATGSFVLAHQKTEYVKAVAAASHPLMPPKAAVHAVEKTARNPFHDMITLGRAENNDI